MLIVLYVNVKVRDKIKFFTEEHPSCSLFQVLEICFKKYGARYS